MKQAAVRNFGHTAQQEFSNQTLVFKVPKIGSESSKQIEQANKVNRFILDRAIINQTN